MRIVVDLQACQSLPHRERGIGRYAMAFTKALLRNAKEDDVWVALNGEIDGTIEPIRGALTSLIDDDHIVVWRSLRGTAAKDPSNLWRAGAANLMRSEFIAQTKPDVMHFSSLFEGYIDDVTCSAGPGQSYVTSVSLYDLIPLEMPGTYLTDSRLRNWYMGRIKQLKNTDLILGISNHTCRRAIDLLGIPSERAVPVMAGVGPLFSPGVVEGEAALVLLARFGIVKPFVMFTGGLDPRKNIDGLIAAYGSLEPALRVRHQLVVVCDAPVDQMARLQTLATQCGLQSGDLVLTGYVSDADLVALYSLCNAFVFPSLSEGFGFPPLEAMACGAAVIGSNTSSIPEVIGDPDALFDPRDQASITEKLQLVLTDEALRDRLRHRAIGRAAEFTWDSCAKRALAAMRETGDCARERKIFTTAAKTGAEKPLLAYVSPVPPVRSGIADYSAELLPALAEHYRVEVVSDQQTVTDAWISKHLLVRSHAWFDAHADRYDRIVYQVGNSAAHAQIPDLLMRHPGVLVLHELHLGGLVSHLELASRVPGYWTRSLYESHGYHALVEQAAADDVETIIQRYPCTLPLIRSAEGVIVHNQYCRDLAGRWFGPDTSRKWVTLPHLRVVPEKPDRGAARRALGLEADEFLVCCFGILSPFKCDREIIEAWLTSSMNSDPRSRLVFVGGAHDPAYAQDMERLIGSYGVSNSLQITGWIESDRYHEYLAAADLAVQLRKSSRGETSGTVLDCLAFGVPTIVNAHASLAELPDETVEMMSDEFTCEELASAIDRLRVDRSRRETLAEQGRAYCRCELDPAKVAEQYRDAIDRLSVDGPHRALANLARDVASIDGVPSASDVGQLVASIAANQSPVGGVRQLLVDVSELVRRDAHSGIQRVVRSILNILLRQPPSGFRVEPVYSNPGGRYRYARAFTAKFLGFDGAPLPADDPLDVDAGDVLLGLDLALDEIPANAAEIEAMRERGVKTYFVVYDQLPLRRPDCFPPHAQKLFTDWMRAVASLGDGLVAISRSVESDISDTLGTLLVDRERPLKLGYFHLGANLDVRTRGCGVDAEQERCIERLRRESTFLMVGTIEPRKGHAQALDAFDVLWGRGNKVNLVLVGKPGWMTDGLVQRIRDHVENGKRLLWFEQASDELLLCLYSACSVLLLPSEGEGFGLPLIEAAQHGLPILCRDLPVFQEVAGEHAYYFSGREDSDLVEAIDKWLALNEAGSAPASKGMPWLNWKQATQQLVEVVLHDRWNDAWMVGNCHQRSPSIDVTCGDACA